MDILYFDIQLQFSPVSCLFSSLTSCLCSSDNLNFWHPGQQNILPGNVFARPLILQRFYASSLQFSSIFIFFFFRHFFAYFSTSPFSGCFPFILPDKTLFILLFVGFATSFALTLSTVMTKKCQRPRLEG